MNLRLHKLSHYFENYRREFGKNVKSILEIGVPGGGSMQLWQRLYPEADVYGIDIDPRCAKLPVGNAKVFIGSQTDRQFLLRVCETIGTPQVIVDDGSHWPGHQIVACETLWPMLASPGVYCIEDICTFAMPIWKFGNFTGNIFRFLTKQLKGNMHRHWFNRPVGDLDKVVVVDSMIFLHKQIDRTKPEIVIQGEDLRE